MHENHQVKITTYDRLLRAWQNSMEMTRDFETNSKSIEDNEDVKQMFKQFAEDEGMHASKLRTQLLNLDKEQRRQ